MSLGPWQIAIIVMVVALLFGGKRIASMGSTLGRTVGRFGRGMARAKSDEDDEDGSPKKRDDLVDSVVEVARVAHQVRKVTRFPFK